MPRAASVRRRIWNLRIYNPRHVTRVARIVLNAAGFDRQTTRSFLRQPRRPINALHEGDSSARRDFRQATLAPPPDGALAHKRRKSPPQASRNCFPLAERPISAGGGAAPEGGGGGYSARRGGGPPGGGGGGGYSAAGGGPAGGGGGGGYSATGGGWAGAGSQNGRWPAHAVSKSAVVPTKTMFLRPPNFIETPAA